MARIRRHSGITTVRAVALFAVSVGLAVRTGMAAELHATIAVRTEPTSFSVANELSAKQAEQIRTCIRETQQHIASEIQTNETALAQDLHAQELHYRDRLQQNLDAQLSAVIPAQVSATFVAEKTSNEPLPLAIRDTRDVQR